MSMRDESCARDDVLDPYAARAAQGRSTSAARAAQGLFISEVQRGCSGVAAGLRYGHCHYASAGLQRAVLILRALARGPRSKGGPAKRKELRA